MRRIPGALARALQQNSGHPLLRTSLFGYAQAQAHMCGLGLYADAENPWWSETGGYAFLRRPVPIYLVNSAEAFAESRAGFNYAIAPRLMLSVMPGFSTVHCARDYCLFHQPVQCQPTSAHEISNELARTDQ